MAKTFNRMRIDVNEKPNSICINPVQNDTQSRYLDVSLYNNGLPIDLTGEVVRINFKKEDGTTFFNQGEITNAAEGRCQFALTNEVLSEAKTLKAQISIWSGEGEILSTQVFIIYVTESIRNDEEVESTNEFGVLVVLFQEIRNALETIGETTDTGGSETEGSLMAKSNSILYHLKQIKNLFDESNFMSYKVAHKYASTPVDFTFEGKMNVIAIFFYNATSSSKSLNASGIEIEIDGITRAVGVNLGTLEAGKTAMLCMDFAKMYSTNKENIDVSLVSCSVDTPLESIQTTPYRFSCEEGFSIKTGMSNFTGSGLIYCFAIYRE